MAYNLRYYTSFYSTADTRTDDAPDLYEVEILELDGVDAAEELEAAENPVTISYNNSSDNKLLALRGSWVDALLIATEQFQLEDLYTENERKWLITIDRNGSRIHNSFIIPDGCQEQFIFPPYIVSINAVDGLGLLKNLSWVQNDGNFWLGKMTWIEVIYACLNRVAVPGMDIYTCVNIYEITMTQGDQYDPLALSYVNSERFLKPDGFNPMDCQEVLLAVLEEWTACIIQSEGHWFIYRPNEAALSGTLTFRRYVDGVYLGYVSKDIDVLLGGYTEGTVLAPLYHVDADQLKMIAKPYKNASIGYKYGFVASLMENPNFTGWDGANFPDWSKSDPSLDVTEDTEFGGAKINAFFPTVEYLYNTTPVAALETEQFLLSIGYHNFSDGASAIAQVILTDGVSTYYLYNDGSWSTDPAFSFLSDSSLQDYTGAINIATQPAPIDGDITIRLLAYPAAIPPDKFVTYMSANLSPSINPLNPIGEIHTATQDEDYTFVPETLNVFNGDNDSEQYIGGIYREDETTLTTLWNRRGISESVLATPYAASKPFLRIAVEEIQRLYASPFVKFEGSIFNYFNPLSRLTINLLDGKFMPDSLVYSLQENKCRAVSTRIANAEIEQAYTLQSDFGETTKMTIKYKE